MSSACWLARNWEQLRAQRSVLLYFLLVVSRNKFWIDCKNEPSFWHCRPSWQTCLPSVDAAGESRQTRACDERPTLSPVSSPTLRVTDSPSYGDCLEVKREYYQNCSVLDCVTQCSQSAAHLYEQFLQVQQIGFVTFGLYAVCRGGCVELYYCNMVEWFWWDSNLIFDNQLVSFSALTLLFWSSGL